MEGMLLERCSKDKSERRLTQDIINILGMELAHATSTKSKNPIPEHRYAGNAVLLSNRQVLFCSVLFFRKINSKFASFNCPVGLIIVEAGFFKSLFLYFFLISLSA